MSEPKKNLDEIVAQARTLKPDQQLRFLQDACADDRELYRNVMARMQSRQAWNFNDETRIPGHADPLDGRLADRLVDRKGEARADVKSSEQSPLADGENIGSYRVIRSLGRGGMGEVFLAERADDQFRQQVAIKLVRGGSLSPLVQIRLKQERQILASLDNPNIARLYDGGTTKNGTPYLVMEYIDGEPIDTYCDRHALTIEQRLRLFVIVCSAVQRAHRSLIVHRDLKPSNILVTAAGVPKLLDFGIAKLLDDNDVMHTMAMTQADVRVMTPDHASPEQIRGDLITTASDIYVLGVLLYELLCGSRPFVVRSTRLAELELLICEQMPPALSAATLAPDAPVAIEQVAVQRSVTVPKLQRELGGDLENIVMMAMRKEPERRYSSVEQFASDVERYLTGMPVLARPDAWAYRATKFLRRNAVVVSLSGVLLTLLVGFSVSTYIQSKRIATERDVANAQRARAEQVATFLTDSFRLADPVQARGKEITAREILDTGANRITKELHDQPALQAELLDTIGGVYLSLGNYEEAEPLVQQGLALRRDLTPGGSADMARSLLSLNRVYEKKGDLTKSEQYARESLALTRQFHGERSVETATSQCRLGVIVRMQGELDFASNLFNQCLATLTALNGAQSESRTLPLDNLGRIAIDRGDYAQAEKLYGESLELDRVKRGEDHPYTMQRLVNLASVKGTRGDMASADEMFRRALGLYERVMGPEHPETVAARSEYGSFLTSAGRLDEAAPLLEQVLEANRRLRGAQHAVVGNDLERLGRVEYRQKKLVEAETHLAQALAIYRKVYPAGNGLFASTMSVLGRVQLEQNRPKVAEVSLREAMDSWRVEYGEASRGYASARASLGRALALQGRLSEAEPALVESYPVIVRKSPSGVTEIQTLTEQWIKELYRDLGRPQAAEQYFAKIADTAPR
ncbi:MAG TPA: serine/threonine-protein kinase [Steroidobacteraceae bacterium]|nr:serine/threonine-protein kinase [Steroidobacteraceae bacterium]